jgi:hypothetical protein
MRDIPQKTDGSGDTLGADEFNSINNELENSARSADFTLDPDIGPDVNLFMLSQSMAAYAHASSVYDDSGSANTYVLSIASNLEIVSKYYKNMCVKFKVKTTNTGDSTVNVSSLGVKSIKNSDGSALIAGDLIAGTYAVLIYNSTDDRFEFVFDYLASQTGTEILTNKTLTSPRINTPDINEAVALTATATELNTMDGITASTAELNQLDGKTVIDADTFRAFRVYLSSNQAYNQPVTDAQIAFNTEVFDVGDCFNTTTHKYTPDIAGYYFLHLNMYMNPTSANFTAIGYIEKNGSPNVRGFGKPSDTSANGQTIDISCLVYANGSTDYFDCTVLYTGTANSSLQSSSENTQFSGHLVR